MIFSTLSVFAFALERQVCRKKAYLLNKHTRMSMRYEKFTAISWLFLFYVCFFPFFYPPTTAYCLKFSKMQGKTQTQRERYESQSQIVERMRCLYAFMTPSVRMWNRMSMSTNPYNKIE